MTNMGRSPPTAAHETRSKAEPRRGSFYDGVGHHKRALVLVAGIALVTGVAATAAALTLTSLDGPRISLFGSTPADSNFTIQSFDTKIKGKAKLDVDLTLKNTDPSNPHRANVTVELLSGGGTTLASLTKDTGLVAAAATLDLTFQFDQSGLIEAHEETFIVIADSS